MKTVRTRNHRLTISLATNFLLVLVLFGRLFWSPGDIAKLVKDSSRVIESRLSAAEDTAAQRTIKIDAMIAEIKQDLNTIEAVIKEDRWRRSDMKKWTEKSNLPGIDEAL